MKSKLVIIGVILAICGLVLAVVKQGRRANYNINYKPKQPISFSHKTHAGDNQIACLYCHYAAEKGRHAGIPPTELCMNCHSQIKKDSSEIAKITDSLKSGKPIEWTKVNHYPDFAYFNHSQHVRVGNISCQECHGAIETMPRVKQVKTLEMGWCLECHREKGIAPPNDHKSKAGGDCARCHY